MEKLKIIRPNQLAKKLGVSKQTLWRMKEELPQPIRIGKRAKGWLQQDILEWLEERKEEQAA
ncbi:MAG TPA: AlpA family phage regulatory protein [Candidatus Izemoplasmatales bacterium]|nr:AlpA family phage regulatory protein [Candidatus Izemoplasmatales bacterium]